MDTLRDVGSLCQLFRDYEDIRVYENKELGYTGIVAVHDTTLGPALGGLRRMHYPSLWHAFVDVTRLARGMTNKAAMTNYYKGGLPLGGGKSVMIPYRQGARIRHAQFADMGRFVDTFGGKYITAEDVGTSVADIHNVAKGTKHLCGEMKGHPYGGDPSPYTALGVYHGMRGALRALYGGDGSLEGRTVYIEGIGKVGFALLEMLAANGAKILVSNRSATQNERDALMKAQDLFGAMIVLLDHDGRPLAFPEVEIYAPCALGATVSSDSIPRYPTTLKLIAGSANNVLRDAQVDGPMLQKRGIAYAPDYVINNSGLRDVYHQLGETYYPHIRTGAAIVKYDAELVREECKENDALIYEILSRAKKSETCPHVIADRMAKAVIDKKKLEFAHT